MQVTHNRNLQSAQHLRQAKNTEHQSHALQIEGYYRTHCTHWSPSTISVRKVRNLRILRGHINKPDTKVTDLDSEENKPWFYKKNQYCQDWTLSSSLPESLQDECTVTPAISLHGEPLDLRVSFIATYHNIYAIIIVVRAFVAMESPRLAKLVMTYHVYVAGFE